MDYIVVSHRLGGLALWFDAGTPPALTKALTFGFILISLAILLFIKKQGQALTLFGLILLGVLFWWLQLDPSNDRNWSPDVAKLATVTFDGNIATVNNVRNFDYRSEKDFSEQWETRTYDLTKIRGVDLYLSYWGSPWMAHTVASWEFEDGQHLAISIETRKQVGEEYSAIRGFFRQYELYYVVADERDVIRVRTNYRDEEVYLYRIKMEPEKARALLMNYLTSVNAIAAKPKWYNAFTTNCTTTIRANRQKVGQAKAWDWRILANGYGDELLYERGEIDNSQPFAELRKRSYISERAKAADSDPHFSKRIRFQP